MSTAEVHGDGDASVRNVDMNLEVIVIPVSDVDRAKEFYGSLGWRLDADVAAGDDFRLIQFTPPGSGCSVQFGTNLTSAAPGSAQGLYLVVSDIEAVRDELGARGVEVSEVFHEGARRRSIPRRWPRRRAVARSQQLRLVRLVQRSGRQRLAVPGGHDAAARPYRLGCDDLRVGGRSGGRASAGVGRPRRAREAHGRGRPELARLVRRIHGARAGRRRTALLSDCVRSGPGGRGRGRRGLARWRRLRRIACHIACSRGVILNEPGKPMRQEEPDGTDTGVRRIRQVRWSKSSTGSCAKA